jgi:hypothetical protein
VARTLDDAMIQFVSGRLVDGRPRTTGDGRPLDVAMTIAEADRLAAGVRAVCMKCGKAHPMGDVLRTWRRMKRESRVSNNLPQRS